jgi:hypothetical protein
MKGYWYSKGYNNMFKPSVTVVRRVMSFEKNNIGISNKRHLYAFIMWIMLFSLKNKERLYEMFGSWFNGERMNCIDVSPMLYIIH